ncbi:hypothetical protein Z951_15300 [Streptomyces sp. PRh5]|nr:hypothetical protein Z951_15300 [Streptomyces sp. PRh5]
MVMSLAVVGLLPATASATAPTAVATDKGAVRGATSKGVERFLGIPYAAAPTGSLRWKPPRPAARWTGVRQAVDFGSPCPVLPSGNGPRSETEDCLDVTV